MNLDLAGHSFINLVSALIRADKERPTDKVSLETGGGGGWPEPRKQKLLSIYRKLSSSSNLFRLSNWIYSPPEEFFLCRLAPTDGAAA